MLTLIITDSRGQGLQELLNVIPDLDTMRILHFSGAGCLRATLNALPFIDRTPPDLVILMAGICDITIRNKITKITTIKELSQEELLQGALTAIKSAIVILEKHNCKRISIATVTGIELADYNNRERKFMTPLQYDRYRQSAKEIDVHQEEIDTVIVLLNKEIVAINRRAKNPTTWTANAVHAYFKKAYHHYYKHLQDGCHATTRTKQYWANQISRTVRIIKKRLDEQTHQ